VGPHRQGRRHRQGQAILAGGVERVRRNEPLSPIRVDINPATLVVGGGIAGISATLEIADAGSRSTSSRRTPRSAATWPSSTRPSPSRLRGCILTPRVTAGTHPNVELLTWSEVEKVEGYVGNFTVTVRKKGPVRQRGPLQRLRRVPGEVPQKVLDEVFEAGLGYRKAIYTPFDQAVPRTPDRSTADN